jgi:hypothetical protein
MAVLPALVSLEDFALRVGGIDAADEDRAQAALDDASALVRADACGEDWVDDNDELEEVPGVITAIVIAVAVRAWRNPDGVRSETIGNYSVAYGDTSTAVFITEGERRLIRRAAGCTGIGSIALEGEWTLNPSAVYVPVEGGGDDFPLGVSEGDLGWRLSGSN